MAQQAEHVLGKDEVIGSNPIISSKKNIGFNDSDVLFLYQNKNYKCQKGCENMILAKALKKGDTIGLFSPSSPVSCSCPNRYKRGKEFLEKKGFKIKEGNLTGKKDFYRSGSIKERAQELNELIRDDSVRCIMSTIGGMNSNSLLPFIDYDALKKDPKIIIGYSDVTALLLGIYEKTGLVTFYGPACAASFGEFPPFSEETYSYFESIVTNNAAVPFTLPTPKEWTDEFIDWEHQERSKKGQANRLITLKEGTAEGRLIGGNLNTISGIFGTSYMPAINKGDILFIEDSLKDIATEERSLSHLKLSGAFEKISGLLLGKHECFDDLASNRTQEDVLKEVLEYDIKFPVLSGFDCCHTHPMLTIPIGVKMRLDSSKQQVTVLERFLK